MTIKELNQEFNQVVSEVSTYQGLITRLDDARYCKWPGQADDGRKYSKFLGKPAFPWEGASDIRPFYIDDLILDDCDIMRTADINCHPQLLGSNSNNDDVARSATAVMDYVSRMMISEEFNAEKELAAQWRQHYGSSCIGVDWHIEMDARERQITVQDLMQIAQQDQDFGNLLQYVMSNLQRISQDDLGALQQKFSQYFPGVNPQQAFTQLQQQGYFTFSEPYVRENRPCLTAYRIYQDVFFYRSTGNIQRAPWVVRRDVLSQPEAEDRAKLEQWDPKFTQYIINNTGGVSFIYAAARESVSRFGDRMYIDELENRCEVFYGFYRGRDQQGNRQTQVCIFHPGTDIVGRELPLPYTHGQYPFILCRREFRARSVVESRGIGDIADTSQAEIKIQRDSRNDRTSITTIPPLLVPLGRGKQEYRLGPASKLGIMRPGEISWLNPPPMDQSSFDTESATRRDTGNYFGKSVEGVDPNKVLRKQQRLINAWLGEIREVMLQVFKLCLQFMPPDQWQQISGDQSLQFPTDEQFIQNNMNLILEYDARDLNMEYLKDKLQLINTMLVPMDAAGSLDRAGLVQYATTALDPALAQRVIKPQGQVTQQEIVDEQGNMAKIVSGVEPPVYQSGQNAQLRLQVIQSTLQAQDFLKFLQNNPMAMQRLQNRVKNLQFQIQQQQNAQTGRIGVQPPPIQAVGGGGGPAPPPSAQQ